MAERLVSPSSKKSYSSLSVVGQTLYDIKIIYRFSKSVFYPVPQVESCFVSFVNKKDCFRNGIEKKEFISFVRQAFQKRRKTLLNNFDNLQDKEKVRSFFKDSKQSNFLRAENLSPKKFLELFYYLR